jgi:hypothetical protein
VEVHSDAQHDLSPDDPTTADRQSESSAKCDQAADDEPPSDAEHEPSIKPSRSEWDVESVDEQLAAATWTADAVGSADVRSHAAEPDEWEFEGTVGGRVHLLEPAASASYEHAAESVCDAVEEQREGD